MEERREKGTTLKEEVKKRETNHRKVLVQTKKEKTRNKRKREKTNHQKV